MVALPTRKKPRLWDPSGDTLVPESTAILTAQSEKHHLQSLGQPLWGLDGQQWHKRFLDKPSKRKLYVGATVQKEVGLRAVQGLLHDQV